MTIRLVLVLFGLLSFSCLFGQTEVLIEFASAKTLLNVKEDLASRSNARDAPDKNFFWYTLQSATDLSIAVVSSDKTYDEWKNTKGVLRVLESEPLEARNRIPNDPTFPDQWDMEKIEASGAWEYTTGGTSFSGREIVIGVIEANGFQLNHPDLRDNIYVNREEIPGDGIDNDNNGLVDDTSGWNFESNQNSFERHHHGTKVLGTLGAVGDNSLQAVGMNWDIKMVPLQVNSLGQWVAAIDYLTTLRRKYNQSGGAEGAYVVVANMSLGYPPSRTCSNDIFDFFIDDAFDRAGENGVLSVGATSNDFEDLEQTPDLSSDCTSDYLVIVTASDQEDEIVGTSGYSETDVDIAAPGASYPTVDYVSSGNSNNIFRGTSGATPHVTGAIALAYSIDCPTLDEISLLDPSAAALIVKDAILSSGDEAIGNAALTTTGKRLNVRRAIEQLLEQECLEGGIIVQVASDEPAPLTISSPAGECTFFRTLSEEWNIHLYGSVNSSLTALTTELEAMANIVAVEPNFRMLLRGRQPNDPGFQMQDNLDVLNAPEAWELIYGAGGAPQRSPVVTAIFDQNFELDSPDLARKVYINSSEIANNGVDDDANGLIDDSQGYNFSSGTSEFSSGTHGFAASAIVAANADDAFGIAGIDWAGTVLPLQGNSLAHWIEGASYIFRLRNTYNESQGSQGALVVSYLTPQGGTLLREDGQLITNVLDRLDSTGILTIGATVNDETSVSSDFPSGITHKGLLNTAYGFIGDFDGDVRNFEADNLPLFLAADNTLYAQTASMGLRLSGSSAAASLAAGCLALLYQTPGEDLVSQAYLAPSQTAYRLKRLLYRSVAPVANYRNDLLQLNLAAAEISSPRSREGGCKILSTYPNPFSSRLKFELTTGSAGTCPVSLYDPLGRVIVRQNLAIENGYGEFQIELPGFALGLHYLSVGEGKDAEALPVLRIR